MIYLLNLDYLEFRGSSDIRLSNHYSNGIYKFSNGVTLQRIKDYGFMKQAYPFCFKINYENFDLGLFYTKTLDLTYSNGLNINVRIDNTSFYQNRLELIINKIIEALRINQTRIKRLDICYDTDHDILTKFKSLYYDTAVKFRLRNRIKVTGTGTDDEQIIIGSLKSRSKCITIYNKTNEINSSHKEYIRNFHRTTFGYKSIYRIEIRIMEKTLDLIDMDIMKLSEALYVEQIFNTYFDKLVQFHDINTNEEKELITINNTGLKFELTKKSKNQGGIKQIKGIINFLDKECKSNEFRGKIKDLKMIQKIILKKYDLETWYKLKK